MTSIDAGIFLPGHRATGTESINVPLLALDQVNRIFDLYREGKYKAFLPYIGEAISLLRTEYSHPDTPLVNKWIPMLKKCDHEVIEELLCLTLIKYGWDVPENVFKRCGQYAESFKNVEDTASPFNTHDRFRFDYSMDDSDLELSRILQQLGHNSCLDHLTYIARYCTDVINTCSDIADHQMVNLISERPGNVPSKLVNYKECVKILVNMSILSSYIGVKLDIPKSIVTSNMFRTCLLFQPMDLLNFFTGDRSLLDRFQAGVGHIIEEYGNKDLLSQLVKKVEHSMHRSTYIPMIGIPKLHHKKEMVHFARTPLGFNPSVTEYVDTIKENNFTPQLWYCAGIASKEKVDVDERNLVLKVLAGMWRVAVSNYIHTPISYIAEVAKRVNANTDDILCSSYTMRMSHVSWSLKDMLALNDMGLAVGPQTAHMINIFVNKHAKKSQSITGLQKMSEVINGHK